MNVFSIIPSVAALFFSVFLLSIEKVHSQSYGDLRLVQQHIKNASFSAGRLEIYMNSTWGSICADSFDIIDADVACRQLGYFGALGTETSFHTPYGRGMEGPVWLDEVQCSDADLLHILSCSHVGVQENDCDHFSDVAVECIEQDRLSYPNDMDVRLVGDNFISQGMLEMHCNGTWARVCPPEGNKFGKAEGNAICRQLGYTEAATFKQSLISSSELDDSVIWTQELECPENAHDIASCGGTCGTSEEASGNRPAESQTSCVFIECTHSVPYGSLRLSKGSHVIPGALEGRLEVFNEGKWGTVCSQNFDLTTANTSCKQLGFVRALDYRISEEAGFGQGAANSTSLGGMQCTPEDNILVRCANNLEKRNCTHLEDVAVFCTNNSIADPSTGGPDIKNNRVFSMEIFIALLVGTFLLFAMFCACLAVYSLHFSLVPYDTKKELSAHGLYVTEYEGSTLTLDGIGLDKPPATNNQGRISRQKDLGKSDTDSSKQPTPCKEKYKTQSPLSPVSPSAEPRPTKTNEPAAIPKHHSKFTIPPHPSLSSPKSPSCPITPTTPVPPPLVVKRKAEQQQSHSRKDSASRSSLMAAIELQLRKTSLESTNPPTLSPTKRGLPESKTCPGVCGTSESSGSNRRAPPLRPAPYKGIRKLSQPDVQTSELQTQEGTNSSSAGVTLRDHSPNLEGASSPATHTKPNHTQHRVSFKLE